MSSLHTVKRLKLGRKRGFDVRQCCEVRLIRETFRQITDKADDEVYKAIWVKVHREVANHVARRLRETR